MLKLDGFFGRDDANSYLFEVQFNVILNLCFAYVLRLGLSLTPVDDGNRYR